MDFLTSDFLNAYENMSYQTETKQENTQVNTEQDEKKPIKYPRFYWFTMILYPDNRYHLHFIKKVLPHLPLDVIGILHDKDFEDADELLSFDVVPLKKPHIHLVIKTPVQRTLNGMKKIVSSWGVEERFIKTCEPFLMCAYLTHKTDPYKHQYDESEIFGNLDLYRKYTSYSEVTDFERFFNALVEFDNHILEIAVFDETGYYKPSYSELCAWIAKKGLFHLLTGKGNFVYNNMFREKAQKPIVYIEYNSYKEKE